MTTFLSIAENMVLNSRSLPVESRIQVLRYGQKAIHGLQALTFVGGFVCLGYIPLALIQGTEGALLQRCFAAAFVVFMAAQMLGYYHRDWLFLEDEVSGLEHKE